MYEETTGQACLFTYTPSNFQIGIGQKGSSSHSAKMTCLLLLK